MEGEDFRDKSGVLREEIRERPEYYDISSGVHNFMKAKKESKDVKEETLRGF